MNTLPEDIQNTIYKYKHQLEFRNVLEEFLRLWFEEETKIKGYCETRGRVIRTGMDSGMSYYEAVENFAEFRDLVIRNCLDAGVSYSEAVKTFEEKLATIEKYL